MTGWKLKVSATVSVCVEKRKKEIKKGKDLQHVIVLSLQIENKIIFSLWGNECHRPVSPVVDKENITCLLWCVCII